MSKLTRALSLAAMLAAMNLTATTVAAQEQTTGDDAVELARRGERASQEQTTPDAALQRVLVQEHSYRFGGTLAEVVSPVRPAEPRGQSGWLVVALGVLAAALALVGALAAMTARRASRRVRARQAA
jgi:hypothetical protein